MTDGGRGGQRPTTVDGPDPSRPIAATRSGASEPDQPAAAILNEVLVGLSRPQKELSSKYFYDHRGSELFEEITRLPEYYLTRTEEQLLDGQVQEWVESLNPGTLVELGAGSARKTRALLNAMTRAGSGQLFIPIDVSGDFLDTTVRHVRAEYPGLVVTPLVADITGPLDLDSDVPSPVLFVLLGSTLGNFPGQAGMELLRGVRAVMATSDRLLVGLDLRPNATKSEAEIEAAYNDGAGVTAAFNLNVLAVLNARIGANFDLGGFEHKAFYDSTLARIEMHLVSRSVQVVRIGDQAIRFTAGETIRTEISGKYDRDSTAALLNQTGLAIERWCTDVDNRFAVVWAGPASSSSP